MLPILRSDHFNRIQLDNPHTIDIKILKFLVQLTRLLKTDVLIVLLRERSSSTGRKVNKFQLY